MEIITKFKAVDGMEFEDKDKCIEYESLIKEVESIMALLNPKPNMNGCDFENGYGFVQQKQSSVSIVRHKLLEIAKRYSKHKWITQSLDSDTIHPSYADRIMSEIDFLTPVCYGWNRISNIDTSFREWGQSYFAANPEDSPALKNLNK